MTLGSGSAVAGETKHSLAVLEFSGRSLDPDVLAAFSDAARGGVVDGVAGRGIKVITRENMMVLLRSMGKTDCAEGDCEVETARNIGADFVVSGAVVHIEDTYLVTLKLHETKEGGLLATDRVQAKTQLQALDQLHAHVRLLVAKNIAAPPGVSVAVSGIRPTGQEGATSAQQRFPRAIDPWEVNEQREGVRPVPQRGKPVLKNRNIAGSTFANVGMGTGYGWHQDGQLEFATDYRVNAGIGFAGTVTFYPELGYMLSSDLGLSLQGRIEQISHEGSDARFPGSPASGALAVLGRALWTVGEMGERGRFFLSGNLGYGSVRFQQAPTSNGSNEFGTLLTDTVRAGSLLFGVGAGMRYSVTNWFGLGGEIRALGAGPSGAFLIEGWLSLHFLIGTGGDNT